MVDSLQLLNNALSYPRFFLKHKFGICNRTPRDYETIAKKYQQKLIDTKDRIRKFNQKFKRPTLQQKERLLTRFQIQKKNYNTKQKNLDTLVIPHP